MAVVSRYCSSYGNITILQISPLHFFANINGGGGVFAGFYKHNYVQAYNKNTYKNNHKIIWANTIMGLW